MKLREAVQNYHAEQIAAQIKEEEARINSEKSRIERETARSALQLQRDEMFKTEFEKLAAEYKDNLVYVHEIRQSGLSTISKSLNQLKNDLVRAYPIVKVWNSNTEAPEIPTGSFEHKVDILKHYTDYGSSSFALEWGHIYPKLYYKKGFFRDEWEKADYSELEVKINFDGYMGSFGDITVTGERKNVLTIHEWTNEPKLIEEAIHEAYLKPIRIKYNQQKYEDVVERHDWF